MGRITIIFKTFTLGLIISLCPLIGNAQQLDRQDLINSFPKEQIDLVINNDIALSGQIMGYSIVSHSNTIEEGLSDIVYVELVSNTKMSVFKHKLQLTKGKAHGDYFLPTTLKTGHYKLIAYTKWTLNNEEVPFYEKNLYVINPYLNALENNLTNKFVADEGYIELLVNNTLSYKDEHEVNGLKISTDSDSYKKRSKVNLKLQNDLNTINYGAYTISVKKIDAIDVKNHYTAKSAITRSVSTAHLPEMRGELIQGTVVDVNTNVPVAEQAVSLSIPGEHYVYKSVKSNKDGRFYFNVFESHQQENTLIQVVAENRNDFKLVMEPILFDRYDALDFYPLQLDKNLESYITQNSIFNQVESAYYNLKSDSLLFIPPTASFYGKPDITYVLDDFKRFNSVRETFIEVVQEAAIRESNNNYRFLVYDHTNPLNSIFADIKPLLLFDGIQIQDENFVVEYNANDIASVSLVRGVYSLGSVTYNGIIDIKLKKSTPVNLSGSYVQDIEIMKPVVQKKYFKQEHVTKQSRIPDFRTQLLWQPNVEINSDLKQFDFYTSDVPGLYIIEVNGTTARGKSIQLTKTFNVVED